MPAVRQSLLSPVHGRAGVSWGCCWLVVKGQEKGVGPLSGLEKFSSMSHYSQILAVCLWENLLTLLISFMKNEVIGLDTWIFASILPGHA